MHSAQRVTTPLKAMLRLCGGGGGRLLEEAMEQSLDHRTGQNPHLVGATLCETLPAVRRSVRWSGAALTLALVIGAAAPSLVAHHSPAIFDRTKEVTLVGTVKTFRWQNPHSYIHIEVAGEGGTPVLWVAELTSPTYLVAAGWRSNTIKPGDKVSIVVNPVRTGEPAGIFVSLTLADGTVLHERPARLGQ
jgi:hypothetical protein